MTKFEATEKAENRFLFLSVVGYIYQNLLHFPSFISSLWRFLLITLRVHFNLNQNFYPSYQLAKAKSHICYVYVISLLCLIISPYYLLLRTVCACVLTCSVVSDFLQPYGLYPTRLLCSCDFPNKNTGVGCHSLLQRIFLIQELNPCLLHLYHRATWKAPMWWLDCTNSKNTCFKLVLQMMVGCNMMFIRQLHWGFQTHSTQYNGILPRN